MHAKSCELDNIHSKIIKDHIDYFAQPISTIVTQSLKSGSFLTGMGNSYS